MKINGIQSNLRFNTVVFKLFEFEDFIVTKCLIEMWINFDKNPWIQSKVERRGYIAIKVERKFIDRRKFFGCELVQVYFYFLSSKKMPCVCHLSAYFIQLIMALARNSSSILKCILYWLVDLDKLLMWVWEHRSMSQIYLFFILLQVVFCCCFKYCMYNLSTSLK